MMSHVEEKAHAELGPSGWGTWGTCPGSPALSEGMINHSSKYAREGTAAHALLETCILEGLDAEDLLGKKYTVEGETIEVDMEMADAVNTSIAHIGQLIDPKRGDVLMAEQPVPIGHLTGETGAEGTSDIIGVVDDGKTLIVGDFKYGKGVQVYASEKPTYETVAVENDVPVLGEVRKPNGQLAMYALGVIEKYGLLYDEIETIKLVVLQPRIDWFDEFTLTIEELSEFADEVTLAAGRVALNKQKYLNGEELDLVPGEKQCKFCKAKTICPALKAELTNQLAPLSSAADVAEFEDLSLPKKVASVKVDAQTPVDRLAELMRAVPLIESLITAARAETERRLFAGEKVPGFKLVEGKKGNRQWSDETAAEQALKTKARLKVDEMYTKKVLSPTQAEKVLRDRPKVWAKIAPLITQSEGKPSVALESDKRPEFTIAAAIEDFSDLSANNLNQEVDSAPALGALSTDDLMS